MTTLSRAREPSALVAVEHRAARDERANRVGTLADKDAGRVDVAQPTAGGERVLEMELDRVVLGVQRRGDAALCPVGRRHPEITLRDEADAGNPALDELERGRAPRDAATDDDRVEGHVGAFRHGVPASTSRLSINRMGPTRAAIRSRTSPSMSDTSSSVPSRTTCA